jgi:hypothetical protein
MRVTFTRKSDAALFETEIGLLLKLRRRCALLWCCKAPPAGVPSELAGRITFVRVRVSVHRDRAHVTVNKVL